MFEANGRCNVSGPISYIMPSDGCEKDTVLLAVGMWYYIPEFGGYLRNVGLIWERTRNSAIERAIG